MKTVEALALYEDYKTQGSRAMALAPRVQIHGIATHVGPDPYALPSVEMAEDSKAHSRVLCVLPLKDYLKLRHVHRGDEVVIEGNPLGYVAGSLDYVVVKRCRIATVKGRGGHTSQSL